MKIGRGISEQRNQIYNHLGQRANITLNKEVSQCCEGQGGVGVSSKTTGNSLHTVEVIYRTNTINCT